MADNKVVIPPAGLDDFVADMDPQSAIAAQGFSQLGQMAAPMVDQGLKNLQETNDLALRAANGDPAAAQAMAERSAQAVMGSVNTGAKPGLIQKLEGALGQGTPQAVGYMDKVAHAEELLKQARALHMATPTAESSMAVSAAMSKLKSAERVANKNKFAEGGLVDSFLNTVPQVTVAKYLLNDGPADSMPDPMQQEQGLREPLINPVDIALGGIPSAADAIASGMAAKEFKAIVGNEIGSVGKNVKKVAKELPMDEASRLARAKEMGFDTSKTYYHGTDANFDEFKVPETKVGRELLGKGIYAAEHPNIAADYLTEDGGKMLPLHVKVSNPFVMEDKVDPSFIDHLIKNTPLGKSKGAIRELKDQEINRGLMYKLQEYGVSGKDLTDVLSSYGHDAVKGDRIINIFKPNQIRSKFAEFDPSKASSGNISAGIGALGLGAAASQMPEQSFAKGGIAKPQKPLGYLTPEAQGQAKEAFGPPAGLDEFLSSDTNTLGSSPDSGSLPPGLDDFIAPEMNQAKYGTMGQQAIAGLEGAAQGLFGPLAPMAEQGLGIDPEAIRGRAEANPVTHYGTEIAGLVLPAIASGGSSLGLKGLAKFTQAGLLEAAAKKLAPEAGVTLASKIGAPAAKAAIENMLLAGSDETSKMILNDPNQSAETLAANVGLSGLLGAALGGTLGAGNQLWKATVGDKAGKLIEDFKGRILEHMDTPEPVEAVGKELGDYYTKIRSLGDDVYGPSGLKAMDIQAAMPEMGPKIAEQAQAAYDSANKTLSKMIEKPELFPPRLASKLKGDLDAYASALSKEDLSAGDVFNAMQDLKQTLQGYSKYDKFVKPVDEAYDFVRTSKTLAHELRTNLEDSKVWGKAAERQAVINKAFKEYLPTLQDFEKKFTTELNGERVIDPTKINTYINQKGKPNAEIKQAILKNFLDKTEKYKKVIGDSHINLGLESPVEEAGLNATLRTLDEETLGGKLADAFIEKGLKAGGAGTLGSGAGATIGGLIAGVPGATIGSIIGHHSLTPFFNSVLPAISKAILGSATNPSALRSAVELSVNVAKGDSLITKSVKNVIKGVREVIPAHMYPSDKSIEKLDQMVRKVAENPDLLMRQTSETQHYMPDVTQAVDSSKAQAVMYLNTLRPDVDKKAPLDSDPIASPVAKARYENALKIAESPVIILDKIATGTLTQQDITDIGSMYPALYNGLKSKLLNEVITAKSKGEVIPYKTKLSLSMFLAQPLDSTMTPEALQTTQVKTGAGTPNQDELQQSPQGVKSSPALQKMPTMYQTPGQTRQQRAQKP